MYLSCLLFSNRQSEDVTVQYLAFGQCANLNKYGVLGKELYWSVKSSGAEALIGDIVN